MSYKVNFYGITEQGEYGFLASVSLSFIPRVKDRITGLPFKVNSFSSDEDTYVVTAVEYSALKPLTANVFTYDGTED